MHLVGCYCTNDISLFLCELNAVYICTLLYKHCHSSSSFKPHENCAASAASVGCSVLVSGWVPHKILFVINFVYRTGHIYRAVGICGRTLAVMRMC